MKQYMLSVHDTHGQLPTPEVIEQMFADVDKVNDEMVRAGVLVAAEGLDDAAKGVVVDYSVQPPVVTDGPYGETKEQLGGFWVIRVKDLDEALAWAEKATVACRAPVQVRPFQDEPES